jgi:hypothetical protein
MNNQDGHKDESSEESKDDGEEAKEPGVSDAIV